MKRLLTVFVVLLVMVTASGCSQTHVDEGADVTLIFIYADQDIRVTLEDREADKVVDILDGNNYDPVSAGIPSCSFDKNVSLKVGSRVYAIACDACNCIQDFGNLKYFDISKEDMAYIHSLFKKYGGYFPCV